MLKPKFVFISNYINHHQIPFCEAMETILGRGEFAFVQTEPMEEERRKMGWGTGDLSFPVIEYSHDNAEECRKLLYDSAVVLFGWTNYPELVEPRLKAGKLTLRVSERIYKEGRWKAVSPRGLIQKYKEHTRYRNMPFYLLCAGGYVAGDFDIIGAYPDKRFKWGYFPEFIEYDPARLISEKGYEVKDTDGSSATKKYAVSKDHGSGYAGQSVSESPVKKRVVPEIMWSGRLLEWKHPELAILTASMLKKLGYEFHLTMVGSGEMKVKLTDLIHGENLDSNIDFPDFMPPDTVRKLMEKADIYLCTSDEREGWGAVVNEAMNSCCALAACSLMGAVPFLIEDGINGRVFSGGRQEKAVVDLTSILADYLDRPEMRKNFGIAAYNTIKQKWNAGAAARALVELTEQLIRGETPLKLPVEGPCSRA